MESVPSVSMVLPTYKNKNESNNNNRNSLGRRRWAPASVSNRESWLSCAFATRQRLLWCGSASRRHKGSSSSTTPTTTAAPCRLTVKVKGAAEWPEDIEGYEEEVERALQLDGTIPANSDQFVKQISSRAYTMRRLLHQSIDNSSYDVLETNPWREDSKPVYVLTQSENQLCTMKTRRSRSEVERELGLLFSKGGKWRSEIESNSKRPRSGTSFRVLVEDIREGVLVFEDEQDAVRYCDLLQGGGQDCEGVAEIEASSVFDICHKMRALAVLFRRGRTPPLPESLKLNLRARKRSMEDQEELI